MNPRDAKLRACYSGRVEQGLRAEGRVILEWVVGRRGGVRSVEVIAPDLKDGSLARCFRKVVSRAGFSALPDGPVTVSYPLDLWLGRVQ